MSVKTSLVAAFLCAAGLFAEMLGKNNNKDTTTPRIPRDPIGDSHKKTQWKIYLHLITPSCSGV